MNVAIGIYLIGKKNEGDWKGRENYKEKLPHIDGQQYADFLEFQLQIKSEIIEKVVG